MMWVSMLKKKSNTFEALKKFKSFVETEKNFKIVCLKIDQEGKFNSKEFIKFYKENGI